MDSAASPLPSPKLTDHTPLIDVPEPSPFRALLANQQPRVSPVRNKCKRTLVAKPETMSSAKRKREEWMDWINWNLTEYRCVCMCVLTNEVSTI